MIQTSYTKGDENEINHKKRKMTVQIMLGTSLVLGLPQWFKYTFLMIETFIILYAMFCIALQKPYHYPAIPYIKNKEIHRNEALKC